MIITRPKMEAYEVTATIVSVRNRRQTTHLLAVDVTGYLSAVTVSIRNAQARRYDI